MARMKFLCDAERCIECNACVVACKNEHEVPWGVNRRRVVTINDGEPGERSISVACMHCSDAPCKAVCPGGLFLRHRRRPSAARQGHLHRLRVLLLCMPVRRTPVPGLERLWPARLFLRHRRRPSAARQGHLHRLRVLLLCMPVRRTPVPGLERLWLPGQDGQVHLLCGWSGRGYVGD